MRIKAKTAIVILIIYLMVYIGLFAAGLSISGFSYLFLIAPIILIGVVYSVLKDDSYWYPELGNEEWGYRDKARDELGLF
jgi:hypothetical protein